MTKEERKCIMKVLLGVSNKHVHVSAEDYKVLFGNVEMENVKDLVQPGQYASNLFVDVKTEAGELKHLRVLGPVRNYTQVELAKTDSFKLKINPPVRESGNLEGASLVTLVGPNGEVTKECAIIANRHIHVNKEIREEYGLVGVDEVKVVIPGEKGAILEHVSLKDADEAAFEFHIDTDDANATLAKTGDMLEVIVD